MNFRISAIFSEVNISLEDRYLTGVYFLIISERSDGFIYLDHWYWYELYNQYAFFGGKMAAVCAVAPCKPL